ncbi:MAG: Response regulator [Campylobacterota bacterium]|nr:Response regulator [Campylobacterota bacterium]
MDIEHVRILIASEDIDANEDLLLIFEEKNISILVVSDIEDTKYIDIKKVSDLVIIDLAHSKKSFLEAIIDICIEGDFLTPIVYIKSNNEKELAFNLLQKAPAAIITKPFNLEKITSLLEKILKNISIKKKIDVEHQYHDILMQTAIVSKANPEGIITYANDNFCKLSGYERAELIGKPHNIVRHPDMPKSSFEDMWKTIKNKQMWHGRVKNLKKNGGYYTSNVVIVPLLDDRGEITEYMAIRSDITKLEMMQEKIIKDKEREKEILARQHTLEEVSKTKDELLVVFTHELKTPLNAIINFSEYVAKKISKLEIDEKKKLSDLMLSVKKNALEMLDNIVNIIDLSKLKSGKMNIHLSLVDVKHLIEDLLIKFAPIIEHENIDIHIKLEEGCIIESDRLRFSQIISNVLSNAIKYGNKKVLITLKKEGRAVLVGIEDNGDGISDKEKIFELYEQGDNSKITRKSKGTGVGLHFVKYLCKELGMVIDVEKSTILGGARFLIKKDL